MKPYDPSWSIWSRGRWEYFGSKGHYHSWAAKRFIIELISNAYIMIREQKIIPRKKQ